MKNYLIVILCLISMSSFSQVFKHKRYSKDTIVVIVKVEYEKHECKFTPGASTENYPISIPAIWDTHNDSLVGLIIDRSDSFTPSFNNAPVICTNPKILNNFKVPDTIKLKK